MVMKQALRIEWVILKGLNVANFDRCVWFNKKKNRTLSRLEIIYNCILSAKSIKSAMTMLSKLNIGSQDMPGGPKRTDGTKKTVKPTSKKTKKVSTTKPSYKK